MKVAVLALVLFAAVVSANVNAHLTAVGRVRGADKEWSRFVKFVHEHKREYKTVAEVNAKFDIFRENMKIAAERQRRNPKATFGVTKFSDITQAEFEATYLMSRDAAEHMRNFITEQRKIKHVHIPRNFTAGADVDWCAKGMCTAIKDQAQCGSCWAFSATETFESALIQAGKGSADSMVLGPQQIVSCDTGGSDQGCNGGMPAGGISYLQSAGGQCSEQQYPYTSQGGDSGQCQMQGQSCPDGSAPMAPAPGGSTPTTPGDDGLQAALAGSCVSVGVDASQWNSYTGGVLTDCGTQLDHAVVATGFASDQGGYYIVRNSWGAGWGENGFIFIAGSGDVCGITDNAITVQV
jgi:C1A family cysteine protease